MTTGIGYTETRDGACLEEMLDPCDFVSVTWSLVDGKSYNTNALTGHTQGLCLAPPRWRADYTIKSFRVAQDVQPGQYPKRLGQIRAWLVKAGSCGCYYRGYDPSWRPNNGFLAQMDAEPKSVTKVLPEIDEDALYPHDELWPSDELWPGIGKFPEYTFTLTATPTLAGDLVVSTDIDNGKSISVVAVSGGVDVVNDNPWNYANGVRPGYEEALAAAKIELDTQLNLEASAELLTAGDVMQINDQYLMITKDFMSGDTEIEFSPALRHPVAAGTQINVTDPACVMAFVDNKQVNLPAVAGLTFGEVSFSMFEVIR